MDLPGGPANAGETGLIPARGRSHMQRGNKPMRHNYGACALELAKEPRAATTEPACCQQLKRWPQGLYLQGRVGPTPYY